MADPSRKFKAAAVQLSPVLYSREGTTDKVCAAILEAGRRGAELVVFPETFIPYYPYFSFIKPPVGTGAHVAIEADVSTPEGAAGFVLAAATELGAAPDILVANAGGPPPGSFASTPIEAYEPALRLNLLSVVAMCQAAVPAMQAREWGRVVAITSISVKQPIGTLILSNTARAGATAGVDPVGFRRLFGEVGIIDLDTPAEVLSPALHRMRVFAGYAGWSPGQLDAEIEQDSWYVVDGVPEDVFGAHPARLRADVLRRQPGELAWVATRPEDAAMN